MCFLDVVVEVDDDVNGAASMDASSSSRVCAKFRDEDKSNRNREILVHKKLNVTLPQSKEASSCVLCLLLYN